MKVTKKKIGSVKDEDVFLVELVNSNHLKISVSNLGATITSVQIPDKSGAISNIVLGYDSLKEYIKDPFYVGATVGRFAGRISKGRFTIDKKDFRLPQNDGATGNHLHGGINGFNNKIFTIVSTDFTSKTAEVSMHYRSADMEEGYPGNLEVWITFVLTGDNELNIHYEAQTDRATHVNLTNHSYFNLSGTTNNALAQKLFINAGKFLKTDKNYIPTGEIRDVEKTNDFRIAKRIDTCHLEDITSGYKGFYVLNSDKQAAAAILFDEQTERKMEVRTSLPGLVFYDGEYLNGKYNKNAGVCLETQFFPDTPNHPEFPSTLLLPGELYDQYSSFKFSW